MRHKVRIQPDWLILTGIMFVVGSILLSGVWTLFRWRKIRTAENDLMALIVAAEYFYREYGIWPSSLNGQYGDVRYGKSRSNAEVLNILRAKDGIGNKEHAMNLRRIQFLESPKKSRRSSGLNEEGELIDPWGMPYQMVVDTDLDGGCSIEYTIYGRVSGQGVAVWSYGHDKKPNTADDICSWKL